MQMTGKERVEFHRLSPSEPLLAKPSVQLPGCNFTGDRLLRQSLQNLGVAFSRGLNTPWPKPVFILGATINWNNGSSVWLIVAIVAK